MLKKAKPQSLKTAKINENFLINIKFGFYYFYSLFLIKIQFYVLDR